MRKIILSGVAVVGLLAIGLAVPSGAIRHADAARGLIVAQAPDGAAGTHPIILAWMEPPDPC
jgi:hypothetical protein